MIVTTNQLKTTYKNTIDVNGKVFREVKKGNLIPILKGMFETDPNINGSYLTQYIYGPSYISFDFALSIYGLIPEAVYNTFTCASYNKHKIKRYDNKFGTFIYRDVPKEVFYLDVIYYQDGDYSYHLATPEKALCDKLYICNPVQNLNDLKELLFDNLRIDLEKFNELNKDELLILAPLYHSTNLNFLYKFIKGDK